MEMVLQQTEIEASRISVLHVSGADPIPTNLTDEVAKCFSR